MRGKGGEKEGKDERERRENEPDMRMRKDRPAFASAPVVNARRRIEAAWVVVRPYGMCCIYACHQSNALI